MGSLTEELGDFDFSELIDAFYGGGWFEYVFPFLLVYAVVLTILNKVSIFDERKPVKVIIAFVFAIFAVSFPITGNFAECGYNTGYHGGSSDCETLGGLMMSLFPGVTAFAVGVLGLYIVVAMMGIDLMAFFGDDKDNNNYLKYILGGIGLFVVVYYYARGFGWGGFDEDNWLWGPDGLLRDPVLYIVVIIGAMFWYLSKDDESPEQKAARKAEKAAKKAKEAADHHS